MSVRAPRLALAFVALALVCHTGLALPPEQPPWHRAETGHFTLYSDAEPGLVRKLANDLETLRAVLVSLNPERVAKAPHRTWVFVFRDAESFAKYGIGDGRDRGRISGYFLAHPHANYVAIDGSAGDDPSAIIYHEYLHEFARHNLPNVPLWFNEGLAEFYSTFALDHDDAVIGRPVPAHVGWLRQHGVGSLESLFGADTESRVYNEGERQGAFYAQAWAMVHMMLTHDDSTRLKTREFLGLTGAGTPPRDALSAVFGDRISDLERRLDEHLALPAFPVFHQSLDLVDVDTRFAIAPLDHAQALERLGDLLAHFNPPRIQEAEAHFREALRIQPALGAALAGRGYLESLRDDTVAAAALFEEALEADPSDGRTWFLAAANLMKLASRERELSSTPPENIEARLLEARDAFRRSLEIDPDFAEAWAGLGSTWVAAQRVDVEASRALSRAREMLPSRHDITYNLLIIEARLGNWEHSDQLLATLEASGEAELVAQARESLLRTELGDADRLLRAGEIELGLEILDDVLARTSDSGLYGQLAERADQLRSMLEQRNHQILWDQAMALVSESRYDDAARLLEQIEAESVDAEVRRAARDNLRTLRRFR